MNRTLLASFAVVSMVAIGCVSAPRPAAFQFDVEAAVAAIERLLADHGDGVTASIWIGDGEQVVFARSADTPMPVASAIKTAFLIELFAANAGALDRTRPEFAALVRDQGHPTFAHFDAKLRQQIERDLATATVSEVGRAMIRGTGVSNGVYNAAANLTTALFGGPSALTARIHERDRAFAPLQVRRYMLAPRDQGDNEATAQGLAAPLQRIATGTLSGVDAATLAAIRDVMRGREHPRFGLHWEKGGSLDTDPLTRVQSGAFPRDGRPLVYVVMVRQPDPQGRPRSEAARRLGRLASALRDAVLSAVDR